MRILENTAFLSAIANNGQKKTLSEIAAKITLSEKTSIAQKNSRPTAGEWTWRGHFLTSIPSTSLSVFYGRWGCKKCNSVFFLNVEKHTKIYNAKHELSRFWWRGCSFQRNCHLIFSPYLHYYFRTSWETVKKQNRHLPVLLHSRIYDEYRWCTGSSRWRSISSSIGDQSHHK